MPRPGPPRSCRLPGPYTGGQIAGAVALTVFVPLGRLIGLVLALSLLRDERLPERRRMLRVWASTCAVVLTIEVLTIIIVLTQL